METRKGTFVPDPDTEHRVQESLARDALAECRDRGAAAVAAAMLGSGPPGAAPEFSPEHAALLRSAPPELTLASN